MGASARVFSYLVFLSTLLLLLAPPVRARDTKYVYGSDVDGNVRKLAVDRTPALYTGDFGDCLGGQSLFNVTKFDAAYYADNLTIVFHLDGSTNVKSENLMMHISVEAYGTSRFSMTFDPCHLNIYSLCPLNASVPITGWALIPVGPLQIGGIPPIAFSIPDFEGSTKLQIFANSSQTQIGCFRAVMRNGASMSHPEAVAPILAVFTAVALVASFLTAAYGVSISHMRMHYAHSLSVLVVFDAFQSIFLSGAVSVAWPSLLAAWRSNFAWSAGQIRVPSLIRSLDSFAGVSGNASQVGGAGSVVINNGGGLASQIYGRSLSTHRLLTSRAADFNASNPYDYTWAGSPVVPGLPMPGTWLGFPGTLSVIGIPVAHAFIVGLIWFLTALALVAVSIAVFKGVLEGLAARRWMRQDRLAYFRTHWTGYISAAVLRTLFGGFPLVATLALYQFNVKGAVGATAVAGAVFAVFLIAVATIAAHACRVRLRAGKFVLEPDQILLCRGRLFRVVPCLSLVRSSTLQEQELTAQPLASAPFFRVRHVNDDPSRPDAHRDERYIKRFGWLSARYRRSRWWFFAYYLGYQLVRACLLGGAAQSPLAQVYGLLVLEIIALVAVVRLNPFEGSRNTAAAVWMLGLTKVATAGLSIAFLPDLVVDRIVATAVGVVIVVVQGLLVLALLVLVVLGALSSYMSLTRNHEDFKPERMEGLRVRYFEKMQERALDRRSPKREKKDEEKKGKWMKWKGKGKEETGDKERGEEEESKAPPVPTEPYFSVTSVRRAPKIEDEDGDVITSLDAPRNGPSSSAAAGTDAAGRRSPGSSRPSSLQSRRSGSSLLLRGAGSRRSHKASWSSRDFAEWDAQVARSNELLAQRRSSNGSAALGNARPLDNRMSIASVIAQSVDGDKSGSKDDGKKNGPPDTRSPSPETIPEKP